MPISVYLNVLARIGGADSFVLNNTDNAIDPANTQALVMGPGAAGSPNYIGRLNGLPTGTDLDPGWSPDSAYVDGGASVSSILGGYDQIVNAIGSVIANANHSMISYGVGGHNTIVGNSYNWIAGDAARSVIVGSNGSSIQNGSYGVIVGGYSHAVTGTRGTVLGGQNNTMSKTSAVAMGESAIGIAPTALHIGHAALVEQGDAQIVSIVQAGRTTDATATNLNSSAGFIELNDAKVTAGTGKIWLVGMRDGSADGNNDGDYTQVAYEVEFGFWWNGTNGFLFKSGTQTTVTTAPTLDLNLISQTNNDFTAGAAPHLAINTGSLRVKVTGIASTLINWVARIDFAMTLVS